MPPTPDLERVVADQQRRIELLEAQLQAVLAQVAAPPAPPSSTGVAAGVPTRGEGEPTAGPVTDEPTAEDDAGRVDRRRLLRGGGLVAGALAGGVAANVLAASPASAATVTGSGNPGVSGSGLAGDGVVGSTDTSGKSGVYAYTTTNGAIGLTARHYGTGNALEAYPTNGVAVVANGALADGVNATTNNLMSAGLHGWTATSGAMAVWAEHLGTGDAIYATSTNGAAVKAVADSGDGVSAATNATGFAAVNAATAITASFAVLASNTGNGTAVKATSEGIAVNAGTNGGTALNATAATSGTAVQATAVGAGSVAVRGQHQASGIAAAFDSAGIPLLLNPHGGPPPGRVTAALAGSLAEDTNADLWLCVSPGTPGVWRKLAGPSTAGALHPLAVPVRVFDSRAGFAPLNSAKGAFTNQTKTIDAKNNASGVPAGAIAVLVNLAVTNTNSGGYGALWAQGASPGTANINWGVAGTTTSNSVLTALKADGTFQCQIAGTADVIIDVVGWYR